MNGFAKIFASMLRSTVWVGQPAHRKLVWITLLMLADAEGNVWASVPGLARDAEVTPEQVEDALEHFRQPDRYSRTKDADGRRIRDIDGGWHVINHHKYREIQSTAQQRAAQRARDYRARKAVAPVAAGGFEPVTNSVTSVTHHARHVPDAPPEGEDTPSGVPRRGRARQQPRPTGLQTPVIVPPSVTHHANHIRHAFPASASVDPLEDPDPDPDLIPSDPAKDGPAREVPAGETIVVPPGWKPKPRHAAKCAALGIDLQIECEKFRSTRFQRSFPTSISGVDKRFDRWILDAPDFPKAGGATPPRAKPKRPSVPGLPEWVHPDHAAFADANGLQLRREVKRFEDEYHLPAGALHPTEVFDPFLLHLRSRAADRPRAANE